MPTKKEKKREFGSLNVISIVGAFDLVSAHTNYDLIHRVSQNSFGGFITFFWEVYRKKLCLGLSPNCPSGVDMGFLWAKHGKTCSEQEGNI